MPTWLIVVLGLVFVVGCVVLAIYWMNRPAAPAQQGNPQNFGMAALNTAGQWGNMSMPDRLRITRTTAQASQNNFFAEVQAMAVYDPQRPLIVGQPDGGNQIIQPGGQVVNQPPQNPPAPQAPAQGPAPAGAAGPQGAPGAPGAPGAAPPANPPPAAQPQRMGQQALLAFARGLRNRGGQGGQQPPAGQQAAAPAAPPAGP